MWFCTGGRSVTIVSTAPPDNKLLFFFGPSYWDSPETKYITVSPRARLRGKGTKVHEVPYFPQLKDSKAHRIRKRVKIAARKERQDTRKGINSSCSCAWKWGIFVRRFSFHGLILPIPCKERSLGSIITTFAPLTFV